MKYPHGFGRIKTAGAVRRQVATGCVSTQNNFLLLKVCAVLYATILLIACRQDLFGHSGGLDCDDLNVPTDMKCIPGGKYMRGSARQSLSEDSHQKVRDEAPVMQIEISTFFMDTNEVTFADYQKCYKNGKCQPARPNYRTGYSGARQPMLGANWYQARQYCQSLGKRLPTESEWERAARGSESTLYSWGNSRPTCKLAIIKESGKKGCGTGYTWDVGQRPAGHYGLYDMTGNSWEWVADWYSKDYASCGTACAGKDPRGPCQGADGCPGHRYKIVRGGSWWWDAEHALASNRRAHFPANKPFHHFGFRCAKSPGQSREIN